MKKIALISAFLATLTAFSALTSGCISNTRYGTEIIETLTEGSSEGEVIAKHGAPDNIVYLGTPYYNPSNGERGEVDKYLFEYRIGGGSTLLGMFLADDVFKNICYLIDNGRVAGGGFVGEGHGEILLGNDMGVIRTPLGTLDLRFGGFLHPKARAGYGGDGNPNGGAQIYDGRR
jgi:hypothetical protein